MNIFNKTLSLLCKGAEDTTAVPKAPIMYIPDYQNEIYQNPIVYRCIKLLTQNIGSIPIVVEIESKEDEHIKHAIEKPNSSEDMSQFMEKLIAHLMVDGNAYVLNILDLDENLSMYIVDPKNVSIQKNEFGSVIGYYYSTIKGRKYEGIDRDGKCKLLNLKYLNPFGTNESPCQVIRRTVNLYDSILKHNQALMDNAARFSGALIVNGRLDPHQKQELRAAVDSKVGPSKAGHIAILQGDIKWEEMKANVRDADYTDGQIAVVRTIASVFGVPPTMLGILDTGLNNYRESRLHFWEDTILPLARHIISALERWLNMYAYGQIKLKLDLSEIPAFADKTDRRISIMSTAGFIPDEDKLRLCGLSIR